MSHLDFKAYKGVGEINAEKYDYTQSVKVGDLVYISGQGQSRDCRSLCRGLFADAIAYDLFRPHSI